jgi:ribokinase
MPATIHVVGSINLDIAAAVERHPLPGETLLTRTGTIGPGGKGLNQAIAAARLSAAGSGAVRMIGRVGDDAFGRDLRALLNAEGIDATGVAAVKGVPTGYALITVDAAAQNAIVVVSGANMEWDAAPASFGFASGDVVVCQFEIPRAVTAAAFAEARQVRATTVLNPAPYAAIDPALLAQTDVLMLNEIECAQAAGRDPASSEQGAHLTAARDLIAKGTGAVIVTLGAAGALVVEADGRAVRIPGLRLKAVDTTGAGDCFTGALAASLREGHDLAEAAAFANRAAGLSVTRRGAADAIPRRTEVPA